MKSSRISINRSVVLVCTDTEKVEMTNPVLQVHVALCMKHCNGLLGYSYTQKYAARAESLKCDYCISRCVLHYSHLASLLLESKHLSSLYLHI